MAGLGMANEIIHKVDIGEMGTVNVYIQGTLSHEKPVFLTIHDLGGNHYQYEDFVGHQSMSPVMQRSVWLHVDLPGQGDCEEELPPSYTFPSIAKMPDMIKAVLDHFRINQVILFGEGAGANILARFAIMYDEIVLGAVLIHCTAASASFTESLKDKLVNWKLNVSGMNSATESFLIWHRFGQVTGSECETELRSAVENFRQNLRSSINAKNLNKFITSYMQRRSLSVSLSGLKCPLLLISGSVAAQRRATRQFYEDLSKAQKDGDPRLTKNTEFMLIDGVANVLAERPEKVISGMLLFLQGLGLLSNLNMQKVPLQLNRRMSMEDYDRPLGKKHYTSQVPRRLSEDAES